MKQVCEERRGKKLEVIKLEFLSPFHPAVVKCVWVTKQKQKGVILPNDSFTGMYALTTNTGVPATWDSSKTRPLFLFSTP